MRTRRFGRLVPEAVPRQLGSIGVAEIMQGTP
jgi:hypothetical protein